MPMIERAIIALVVCAVLVRAVPSAELGTKFPPGFIWGTATAAFQIEGASFEDGRGQTTWDAFCNISGKVANGATGMVADDSFHRFDEDSALMGDMGVQSARLSLAWSRIIDANGNVNPLGIDHYNKVLDSLELRNIRPLVTLFHWDLPLQFSEMQNTAPYKGWLNASIVPRFAEYARAVFNAFGKRVKHWTTFNEPWTFCVEGYGWGVHAPGRCSDRSKCPEGDTGTEPYLCAHNVLLSHAAAASVYRNEFAPSQGGEIGMTLNTDWSQPLTDSQADKDAAERHLIWSTAWFADPLYFGDYPQVMKDRVGARLPQFTDEQKAMVKGSVDFYGLNHYTTSYVSNVAQGAPSWDGDQATLTQSTDANGNPIGPRADSTWLFVVPWGFRPLLNWVSNRYGRPAIYVTENGCDVPDENSMPIKQALNDTFRINYYHDYLAGVADAINLDSIDVRGYYAWSLLDNFEWADGYSKRFGLHYVDYNNGIARYPKASAGWFKALIANHTAAHHH